MHQYDTLQEPQQPHRHSFHLGSSSGVDPHRHNFHFGSSSSAQQHGFGQLSGMFGYMGYHQNMSSQLPFQVPTTFTAFTSQENMFSATSNMFGTSTMTPPSAFRRLSPMHYYRPTMPLEGFDNPSHDNPPPPPPPPTEPKPQRPRRQKRRPPCGTSSRK